MFYFFRNLIILLILFLVQYYFVRKAEKFLVFRFPGLSKYGKKFQRIVFFIFINIYPLVTIVLWIYKTLFGIADFEYPENAFWDNYIVIPFWVIQLIILQSVLFFATIDILKFAISFFTKKRKDTLEKLECRLLLLITAGFLIYVPLRVYHDWNSVSVRVVEYSKKNLSKDLDDFRLVLISDVQVDKYTDGKRVLRYINKVNSLQPDLILIGGDIITSGPEYINSAADHLGKLSSLYGVYSCIGDHDNWAYRPDNARSRREITEALAKNNVKMLDNKKVKLIVENSSISISFITHTYSKKINGSLLDSVSVPDAGSDLNFFLTHQPQEFLAEKASENGFDIMLAGHTHGGQITLFYPFFNISPTLFETKYIKGDFRIGNMLLSVNRGLGMSLAPVRYNSTPEITLIILKRR